MLDTNSLHICLDTKVMTSDCAHGEHVEREQYDRKTRDDTYHLLEMSLIERVSCIIRDIEELYCWHVSYTTYTLSLVNQAEYQVNLLNKLFEWLFSAS